MIMEKLGVKSKARVTDGVTKHQNEETFEDYRGRRTKKVFQQCRRRKNQHLKAQVEYLKKLNPNLHGREV